MKKDSNNTDSMKRLNILIVISAVVVLIGVIISLISINNPKDITEDRELEYTELTSDSSSGQYCYTNVTKSDISAKLTAKETRYDPSVKMPLYYNVIYYVVKDKNGETAIIKTFDDSTSVILNSKGIMTDRAFLSALNSSDGEPVTFYGETKKNESIDWKISPYVIENNSESKLSYEDRILLFSTHPTLEITGTRPGSKSVKVGHTPYYYLSRVGFGIMIVSVPAFLILNQMKKRRISKKAAEDLKKMTYKDYVKRTHSDPAPKSEPNDVDKYKSSPEDQIKIPKVPHEEYIERPAFRRTIAEENYISIHTFVSMGKVETAPGWEISEVGFWAINGEPYQMNCRQHSYGFVLGSQEEFEAITYEKLSKECGKTVNETNWYLYVPLEMKEKIEKNAAPPEPEHVPLSACQKADRSKADHIYIFVQQSFAASVYYFRKAPDGYRAFIISTTDPDKPHLGYFGVEFPAESKIDNTLKSKAYSYNAFDRLLSEEEIDYFYNEFNSRKEKDDETWNSLNGGTFTTALFAKGDKVTVKEGNLGYLSRLEDAIRLLAERGIVGDAYK